MKKNILILCSYPYTFWLNGVLKKLSQKYNFIGYTISLAEKNYWLKKKIFTKIYSFEEIYNLRNEDYQIKTKELLNYKKMFNLNIKKIFYSYYNYFENLNSKKYKSYFEKKLKKKILIKSLLFVKTIFEKNKIDLILTEHSGGNITYILKKIAEKKKIKIYWILNFYFFDKFNFINLISLRAFKNKTDNKFADKQFIKLTCKKNFNISPVERFFQKVSLNNEKKKFFYKKQYLETKYNPYKKIFYNAEWEVTLTFIEKIKNKLRNYLSKFYYFLKMKNYNFLQNKKYVIYFLHREPEASIYGDTNPLKLSQHELLNTISKNLPDEILLVIKEHPSQFISSNMRNINFYRNLCEKKNIYFIDTKSSNFDLIRNSIFTMTISGTLAVESFILNKYCILFGNNFYSFLKNCILIKKKSQIYKTFINVLKKKYPYKNNQSTVRDWRKFVSYYFNGMLEYEKKSKKNEKQIYSSLKFFFKKVL